MSYLIPPRRADKADVEAFVASVQAVKDRHGAEAQEPNRVSLCLAIDELLLSWSAHPRDNSAETRKRRIAARTNLEALYTAPQPPAPCQGVTDTEYYRAEFEKLQAKVGILDGLSQDAINGGWTYRGMEAYAKGLEAKVAEQAAEIERLNRGMTVYTEAFEAECRTTDEQAALIEQCEGVLNFYWENGICQPFYFKVQKALAAIAAHKKGGAK